ncbi:MAG: hypothetical protein PHF63_00050 [Herbinix sp.]|nr:hypothetical protein [Herbinix sp.]
MQGTLLTSRITDSFVDVDVNNLQAFMEGKNKEFYTMFLLNRMRMYFDVFMIFDTRISQLNNAIYFSNMVRQERPFMIETCLESLIPEQIITMISKDNNIPIFDDNGSVSPFMEFMNSQSHYPVTYKLKNSSGTDEFFRFYPVNLDTTIVNFNVDDGDKKEMVEDIYPITFSVMCDFNTAGLYYYFSKKNTIIDFDTSIRLEDNGKIIPIFTVSNLFNYNIPTGFNIYTSSMYMVESNIYEDVLDISPLFSDETLTLIKYHKDNSLSYNLFLKFRVLKNNVELDESEFEVNIDTMKLTTKKVNIDSTYRLIIYINTQYANELVKRLYNLEVEK